MDVHRIPIAAVSRYQEFIRSTTLSVGVYRLDAGAADTQQPHGEDEVYVVLAGHGRFTAEERTVDVGPGVCLFVAAGERHQFHDILEPLEVIVVFAPPEGSSQR
jgi:mannose-6-phosphate isomerase-like protein (cupin superfamily)